METKMKFGDWLKQQMDERDMKAADLSRRSGLETSAISYILNNQRKQPAVDTCKAVSKALNIPLEEVYRAADILPPKNENDVITEAILFAIRNLDTSEKQDVLEYAKLRSKLADEKRRNQDTHNAGHNRRTSENPA